MNPGNLLENLLTTAGANSAATKNPAVKARSDGSEKFRDTFAQIQPQHIRSEKVRPQVAASTAQANSRVNEMADNRKALEPAHTKSNSRPDPVRKEKPVASEAAGKNNGAEADKAVKHPTDTKANASRTTIAKSSVNDGEEAVSAEMLGDTSIKTAENSTNIDPSALLDLSIGAQVEEEDVLAEDPALLVAPLAAMAVSAESIEGDAEDAGVLTSGSNAQSLTTSLNLAGLGANAAGKTGLNSDAALKAGEETDSEGLNSASLIAEENPDFLVLNNKAAQGKTPDAKVATEPLDTSKPAVATPTPTESFSRLVEAQSPTARNFVVQTGVPVSVGQPQWSQAVGEKVLWLAAQNVSAAEIRLDPPDLGQLHVKVSVNQDQATVTFVSPHPQVREALDQQLNRLREMFSEQGLNLVNVDVSDRSGRQEQEGEANKQAGAQAELDDEELAPVAMSTISATRLVDHYA